MHKENVLLKEIEQEAEVAEKKLANTLLVIAVVVATFGLAYLAYRYFSPGKQEMKNERKEKVPAKQVSSELNQDLKNKVIDRLLAVGAIVLKNYIENIGKKKE